MQRGDGDAFECRVTFRYGQVTSWMESRELSKVGENSREVLVQQSIRPCHV